MLACRVGFGFPVVDADAVLLCCILVLATHMVVPASQFVMPT